MASCPPPPVFIKIRDGAKKKSFPLWHPSYGTLWDCYIVDKKSKFSQRVRRLIEWFEKQGYKGDPDNLRRKLFSFAKIVLREDKFDINKVNEYLGE